MREQQLRVKYNFFPLKAEASIASYPSDISIDTVKSFLLFM